MVRPSKHNVAYFPHDTVPCSKLQAVEIKYQASGYVVFYKLLERLGRATYHFLVLDEDELMIFATECYLDSDRLMEILGFFAKLNLIHKELFHDHGVLFSEYFLRTFATAYEKRKTECVDLDTLCSILNISGLQTYYALHGIERILKKTS